MTLLELGSRAATDIARGADIPGTRIYDVLDDLEQVGYIETCEWGAVVEDFEAQRIRLEEILSDEERDSV